MDALVGRTIAVIPARGGSKRIPGKNTVNFADRPMIAWTIEAALQSGCFDRVIVSTDDPSVAKISEEFGAEVPFLREEFSDDYSPVSEATVCALAQAMNYWQEDYDTVVQLMANCPLRTSGDIKSAMAAFRRSNCDFQISCSKFGWMNPWWAVTLDESGCPTKLFPQMSTQRSQDLPELYCPTGAIWIAKARRLLETRTFYGPDHRFESIPWESAVDIDDFEDLKFAHAVYESKKGAV